MENVDNHLSIIEHHPLAGGKSVNRYRAQRMVLTQPRFDFVRDGFELRLGRTRADHKEICEGRNAAQIQHNDVLGLFARGEFGAALC